MANLLLKMAAQLHSLRILRGRMCYRAAQLLLCNEVTRSENEISQHFSVDNVLSVCALRTLCQQVASVLWLWPQHAAHQLVPEGHATGALSVGDKHC